MAGPRGLTESLSSSSSRTAAAASRPARDAYAQADTRGRRVSPTGGALFDRAERAAQDRQLADRLAMADDDLAAGIANAYAQADARGRRVSPTGGDLFDRAEQAQIARMAAAAGIADAYAQANARNQNTMFPGQGFSAFGDMVPGELSAEYARQFNRGQSEFEPLIAFDSGAMRYPPQRFDPPGLQESYDALAARENNLVYDLATGAYIPANPSDATRLTQDFLPRPEDLYATAAGVSDQANLVKDTLNSLIAGADAERARMSGGSSVPLPRLDPRGYDGSTSDMPFESDGIADAQVNDVPTAYDQAVDFIGDMAVGTPIGGLVNLAAPDAIRGVSEFFKGLDDGVTYGGTGVRTNFQDSASGGSLIEQPSQYAYAPLPFPDVNGNGIDDRLEGIGFMGSQPTNFGVRQVRFPTTPPYDPGRSGEFSYFTGQGYAEGGMVDPMQDPRMELIADTEDVLEDIAEGEPADAEDAEILRAFVAQFGDDALRALNDQVMAGMKMRPSRSRETGSPRLIEGPGTETSDSIPAMIEDAPGGPQPAALSDGEVVIPANAVRAAGQGDREKGAAQLMALSDMLVNGQ
jgi:hypothetical protein